jgi:hypothetical protein
MNYEEKIRELTERVEKLEKAENKRILKRRIEIGTKIVIGVIILILLLIGYIHINNTIIKPYKEKIDYVDEKIDKVQGFIDNKLGGLSKYFK